MKLQLTAEEADFRGEVRAFLAASLPPALAQAGKDATSVFVDPEHTLPWQRILHARGWAAPHWPTAFGGPGWTETQRYIFTEECCRAHAPPLAPMGLKMVAPCIMRFGTPAQRAVLLPRILSGEDYWCQGYSEPGAGSDLAALQLRADVDGDDYVLNGSKIWTTHAHFANRMFCLVRTGWEGKPQAGITFLLLDMTTPGITVSPIVTLAGEHEVNQVFFEDVRAPISGRLGEQNQGWMVAKCLLEFERGGAFAPRVQAQLAELREAARDLPGPEGACLSCDPIFNRRLAELEIELEALRVQELRILSAIEGGQDSGPSSSMLKMLGTEAMQRVDELVLDAVGCHAARLGAAAVEPGFNREAPAPTRTAAARYLNDRAASIYGGSSEIQRDILAKLALRPS